MALDVFTVFGEHVSHNNICEKVSAKSLETTYCSTCCQIIYISWFSIVLRCVTETSSVFLFLPLA